MSEPSPPAADPARLRFVEITREIGVDFVHTSGVDGSYFFPEHVGSGGALFDYDGDGDLDLLLVNSGSHDPEAFSETSGHRLYQQRGDGRFVDRTELAGLAGRGYGMGSAVGDADGDGDLDLYITAYGGATFYANRGDGRFSDVTTAAGLGATSWSTSACFFDSDLDGDLDLYAATYVHHSDPRACTDRAGRREYCGPAAFRAVPDLFYRNLGGGRFESAADSAGIAARPNRGLGVVCTDLDGDSLPDVYVANDGEANQLWINRGDGTFEERAIVLGAALNAAGKPEASMGIALGDVDGDLELDLFASHLDRETNTLYLAGGGGFADQTAAFALGAESLPYTGFGTGFFDPDLDGDLDLLVVNGRVRRGPVLVEGQGQGEEWIGEYRRAYAEPNLLLVNEGASFRSGVAECGDLCARIEVSRGLLFGDIDLDGDPDLVITNSNGPARVYATEPPAGRRWLSVGGRGSGLGTRLLLDCGDRLRLGLLTSSSSYLSALEPSVQFGLGEGRAGCSELRVEWPGGGPRRRYLAPPTDRRLLLVQRATPARASTAVLENRPALDPAQRTATTSDLE